VSGLLSAIESHLSSTMRGLLDSPKGYGNWHSMGQVSDVLGGRTDLPKGPITSDEMNLMASQYADAVTPLPGGLLGTLGGMGAKGARLNDMYLANNNIMKGMSSDDAWKKFGWENSRFEIDDTRAMFNPSTGPLQNSLIHEDLYRAYPDVADLPLEVVPGLKSKGRLLRNPDGSPSGIQIREGIDEPMETVLHEVQHAIQIKEGFPLGGNPNYVAYDDPLEAVRQYLDIPGEREARNVAFRLGFNADELKKFPPSKSEALMREVEREAYPGLYPK